MGDLLLCVVWCSSGVCFCSIPCHLLYSCFYVFYCVCCVLFSSRNLYSSVLQVVDPYVVFGHHPLDIFGLLAYYVDLVCGRHVSADSLRFLVVVCFVVWSVW